MLDRKQHARDDFCRILRDKAAQLSREYPRLFKLTLLFIVLVIVDFIQAAARKPIPLSNASFLCTFALEGLGPVFIIAPIILAVIALSQQSLVPVERSQVPSLLQNPVGAILYQFKARGPFVSGVFFGFAWGILVACAAWKMDMARYKVLWGPLLGGDVNTLAQTTFQNALWLFWLLVIISASTVFYNRVFEPLASQVSRTYAERCGSGGNSETEPLVQSPQQTQEAV